jgi:hypothetical protein
MVMTYAPASGYHLWLIIAIVAFAVLLVLALWPRRRGRPRPLFWRHPAGDPTSAGPAAETIPATDSAARDTENLRNPADARDATSPIPEPNLSRTTSPSARWELSSRAYWITVIAATVVLALVSGWLAFVVPAVLLVGWAVPRWVPWLAFLAMCVAGGFAIAELNHGPQSGFGAFGPAAQFAAVVALAAALISAPRLGRPTPEPAAAPYGPPFTARDPAPGEGP